MIVPDGPPIPTAAVRSRPSPGPGTRTEATSAGRPGRPAAASLAICKDAGVPQHATDTAALGIDAYVTGVLESGEDAAVPDERARPIAADLHVWVAVASFAGSTGDGYAGAAGRSGMWTPGGVVFARAGPETRAVARATLS